MSLDVPKIRQLQERSLALSSELGHLEHLLERHQARRRAVSKPKVVHRWDAKIGDLHGMIEDVQREVARIHGLLRDSWRSETAPEYELPLDGPLFGGPPDGEVGRGDLGQDGLGDDPLQPVRSPAVDAPDGAGESPAAGVRPGDLRHVPGPPACGVAPGRAEGIRRVADAARDGVDTSDETWDRGATQENQISDARLT